MAPEYQYRAVDDAGKGVTGVLSANDAATLETKLSDIGLFLIEFKKREGKAQKLFRERAKKIKRRDLIEFFTQTEALVSSGVTLLDAIRAQAKDASKPALKSVLENIARNIEAGNMLHEAMGAYPKIFSGQVVSMVRAGERSGTLTEVLRELIRYMEWMERLIGDIKQATIYPVMVFLALVVFVTILFTFVVPRFVKILVTLKIALPLPTVIVMGISDFFLTTWWAWLLAAFLVPTAKRIGYKKSEKFAMAYDRMKLRLPVFGKLNVMFTVSRFAQNFASLFNAGVPVLNCLQLCEGLVGNKVMEEAVRKARRDIAEGVMLSESLEGSEIITPMTLRMIAVGEATGDMGGALQNVSDYYNEEIPRRVKKVFGVVEPTIIILLVLIVGGTALAIFMPILSLLGGLK